MAKLGELFGWSENPLYQFWDSNRNTIGEAAGSLAKDGWLSTGEGAMRGSKIDAVVAEKKKEEAQRIAAINATAEAMRGHPDLAALVQANPELMSSAVNEMWKRQSAQAGGGGAEGPASVQEYQFYVNETMKAGGTPLPYIEFQHAKSGPGGSGLGTTIYTGRDANGNIIPMQVGQGGFVPTTMPEGVIFDPAALNAARAEGTAVGRATGEMAVAAPADIDAGNTALDLINQIKTHPELGWATGTSVQLGGNNVAGTGRFGFQKLVDQAKSGAFLTAIDQMRGMGALSNAEGQTATAAITRMDTALSKDDFLKALGDYEAIVMRGIERAQAKIGRTPAGGSNIKTKYGLE